MKLTAAKTCQKIDQEERDAIAVKIGISQSMYSLDKEGSKISFAMPPIKEARKGRVASDCFQKIEIMHWMKLESKPQCDSHIS